LDERVCDRFYFWCNRDLIEKILSERELKSCGEEAMMKRPKKLCNDMNLYRSLVSSGRKGKQDKEGKTFPTDTLSMSLSVQG